jgi:choline dehydrogenase-like flavoprotein
VDVRGLELQGDASVVEADAIVLAAGAIGSPALLLRSLPGSPLGALPMRRRVGRGFGFNYGSPVIARFDDPFARPGWDGLQVGFVVRPEGSDTWIAENGFIEPGLIASCTPGIGALHRSWMADTAHLAMAVNTVGSLPSGVVGADGRVSYRLGRTELDTVRASLAELVDLYLSAGASQVALGGVGGLASSTHFTARDRGLPGAILGRIERAFPSADWLALASGHPQGGLALGRVAAESVTGPDFRVHGTSNLFVADASLFPTPITVNPQWLVQALAVLASEAVQGAFACPVDAP